MVHSIPHQRKSVYFDKRTERHKESGCYFDAPLILNKTISPCMGYRLCRWIIIITFLSVMGVALYFVPSINRETDASLMVPSDSFVIDYTDIFESSFDARLATEVQIIIENEDFSNSETQGNINKFFMDLANHPNYIALESWYQPFEAWLNDRGIAIDNMTNTEFYDELNSFTDLNEYQSWNKEIIYAYPDNNDGIDNYIKATRFYLRAWALMSPDCPFASTKFMIIK